MSARVIVAKNIHETPTQKTNTNRTRAIDTLGQFMGYYPVYTLDMARQLPNRVVHELIRQARRREVSRDMMNLRITLSTLTDKDGKLERAAELMTELSNDYERLER